MLLKFGNKIVLFIRQRFSWLRRVFIFLNNFGGEKWRKIFFWLINFFLFSLPFFWAPLDAYKIGGDDSRLYLYAPWEWFKNIASSSWLSGFVGGFGAHNPQGFYIPFNLAVTAIKSLLPFLNHERVVYGLVLGISFSSIYFIVKIFIQNKNSWQCFLACVAGGLTYVFLPLSVGLSLHNPISYFYVAILYPLIILFFLQALEVRKIYPLIWGSIVTGILSMALMSPPTLYPFSIGFFIFFFLYFLLIEKNRFGFLKYIIIYVLLILLVNSFFILPYFYSIFAGNTFSMGAFNVDQVGGLVSSGVLDSLVGSQALINHFAGQVSESCFSFTSSKFDKYFCFVKIDFGLLLIIFIFSTLLFRRAGLEKEKKYLSIILFVLLSLTFLETVNIGKWGIKMFAWLILHVPGFYSMRWFFIKTAPTFSIFYALGVGLGVYVLINSIKKKIIKIIIAVVLFLIIFIPSLPFIFGKSFNRPIASEHQLYFNVKFPKSYFEVVDFFNNLNEDNRVMTFPLVVASWSLIQGDNSRGLYLGSSPFRILANKSDFNSFMSFSNYFNPSFPATMYNTITREQYEPLKKLLGLLNIRYLIFNNGLLDRHEMDYDFIKSNYVWFWQNAGFKPKYEELLNTIGNKLKEFEDFSIYKIKDSFFRPHIYATNNVFYFQGDMDQLASVASLSQYQADALEFFEINKRNDFMIDRVKYFLLAPSISTKETEDLYNKMFFVADPGTLEALGQKLEIYKKYLFLDDYRMDLPQSGEYWIMARKDSVLMNNLATSSLCFNNQCVKKNKSENKITDDYILLDKIYLKAGEYKISIDNAKEKLNILAKGDLMFFVENSKKTAEKPKIEFKKINQTKYAVKVLGAKNPFFLVLNETFHDGWRVYLRQNQSNVINNYRDEEIIGSRENQGLSDGRFYEVYKNEPLFRDKHFLVNTYANAWWVDLEQIKNQISKIKNYKDNPDGSMDFELVIDFYPQRIFYLSLLVPGLTFIFFLGYLIYYLLFCRKAKSAILNIDK